MGRRTLGPMFGKPLGPMVLSHRGLWSEGLWAFGPMVGRPLGPMVGRPLGFGAFGWKAYGSYRRKDCAQLTWLRNYFLRIRFCSVLRQRLYGFINLHPVLLKGGINNMGVRWSPIKTLFFGVKFFGFNFNAKFFCHYLTLFGVFKNKHLTHTQNCKNMKNCIDNFI